MVLTRKFFNWKLNVITILISYFPHQYTEIYKNSQTTSTKCQYQAAISNPIWWFILICILFMYNRFTDKKVVPIITWIPWKPVAMKKIEP